MQIFAQNQVNARLELLQGVDICSNDPSKRQALFGINIGNVEKRDSLFGFNFEIGYDNTKLQFNRPIYFNTLSEAFDDMTRDVTVGFEPGTIRGYAVHLNFSLPPVWGNKPLIALLFDYLGNTPDTTTLHINYLEFTKEFKKQIVNYEPCLLKVEFIDKPQRFAELYFDKDSLLFDDEELEILSVKLNLKSGKETKIRNINFDLSLDNSKDFSIKEIKSNTDNVSSFELESIDSGIRVKTVLTESFTNGELVEIIINNSSKENSEGRLLISGIEFNPDHCVTRLSNNDLRIVTAISKSNDTTDTTTTAVFYQSIDDSNINSLYDSINDEFIIESQMRINFASFYDLRGLLLKRVEFKDLDTIKRIKVNDLPKGVYIIVLELEKFGIKSLVNIKY